MSVLLLASSIGAVSSVGGHARAQERRHDLTVVRWQNPNGWTNISEGEVDAAFEGANALMRGTGCAVRFARSGRVGTFGFPAQGIVRSRDEYRPLLTQAGYVKLVHSISWCGQTGSFAGCATLNRNALFIDIGVFKSADGPSTLVHEFGHTMGLDHVADATRIMFPGTEPSATRLSTAECNTLRSRAVDFDGPGGEPAPAAVPTMIPFTLVPMPIEELARRPLVDSIPFEAAKHYGKADAAKLRTMLADTALSARHHTVATLLGIISDGDEADAESLIAYLDDEHAPLTTSAALIALGYVANRGSMHALDYLAGVVEGGDQARAGWAIQGLGVSGRPEALAILEGLQQVEATMTLDGLPLAMRTLDEVGSLVAQALSDNAEVARVGLAGYYAH
ncbi:MAG: hypothetical protein ABW252_16225 [Polyangiales bacterium]